MVELLAAYSADVKSQLAEMKTHMANMKAEMADVRAQVAFLRVEMANQKQDIIDVVQERIRDAQTEILKAFLPFQQSTNIRMRKMEADQSNSNAALGERMTIMEGRLFEIEKKLLNYPPAT